MSHSEVILGFDFFFGEPTAPVLLTTLFFLPNTQSSLGLDVRDVYPARGVGGAAWLRSGCTLDKTYAQLKDLVNFIRIINIKDEQPSVQTISTC
uniref:Uncharacterized protein n=1 Tax=Arion vulgaris TaxID=1028688 RepID=A0A0B6YRH9_9EUPU